MDARDSAARFGDGLPKGWTIDETAKLISFTIELEDGEEEISLPFVWEVCSLCDGEGRHVNPSIDSHGLTREDFDEDPDFAEAYRSGRYDQTCNQCHGRRVMPAIQTDGADPESLRKFNEWKKEEASYRAAVAQEQRAIDAERRFGC